MRIDETYYNFRRSRRAKELVVEARGCYQPNEGEPSGPKPKQGMSSNEIIGPSAWKELALLGGSIADTKAIEVSYEQVLIGFEEKIGPSEL